MAALLTLGSLCLFILGMNGYLSLDEETSFLVTEALVERGEVAIERSMLARTNSFVGFDGRTYSRYEAGQSLFAVPTYLLSKVASALLGPRGPAWDGLLRRFCTSLYGPLSGALLTALLYLLGRRLGITPNRSLLAAALGVLGSNAWYYTGTFFREVPLALFHALVLYGMFSAARSDRPRWCAFLVGFGSFGLVSTRLTTLFVPLVVGAYLWLKRPVGIARTGRLVLLSCLAGTMLALGLAALYSRLRWGTPFHSGLFPGEGFTTPLSEGLVGLLFSPRFGLLFHFPLSLLAVWGFVRMSRQRSLGAEGVAIALVFGFHLLIAATWCCWWGGGGWGPRLLVPTLPLLGLGLGCLDPRGSWGRARKTLFAVLVLFSLSLYVLGKTTGGWELVPPRVPGEPYETRLTMRTWGPILDPRSWSSLSRVRLSPSDERFEFDDVQRPELKRILLETPSVWWLLLHRLNASVPFWPVVGLLLLGLIGSGLLLRREVRAGFTTKPLRD